MFGLIGKKIGMTQVFSENGKAFSATIIEIEPNVVTSVFTKEKDGYEAIQLSAFDKKTKSTSKSLLGHFKKAQTSSKKYIKEIRDMKNFELGQKIDASIFEVGFFVDVSAVNKGKGFQGTIKRYNQKIGPKSHGGGGGSKPLRQTGSIGDVSSNKVNKGMTMPGHMGHKKRTIQNLEILNIILDKNILIVKGSIPGPRKSFVVVKKAVKKNKNNSPIKLWEITQNNIQNKILEEKGQK